MTQDGDGQRHDRTALILYGSETGNSQDVAEELGRVAERLHFMTRVCEMDAVELKLLLQFTIVVFVTSTTGQGEFPKNAQKFWKRLLRKRLPPDCLSHVQFTTFGLGDSSYAQFNYAARKLHKRLEQLGAKEVYPRGEADERNDEGIDGTFLSWSADFRRHLLSTCPLSEGVTPIPANVLLPPKILLGLRQDPAHLEELSDIQNASLSTSKASDRVTRSTAQDPRPKAGQDDLQDSAAKPPNPTTSPPKAKMLDTPPRYKKVQASQERPCPMLKDKYEEEPEVVDSKLAPAAVLPNCTYLRLLENKRVTPEEHWQDVRLLTFRLEDGLDYYVGDTLTIYPKNFPEDVQAIITMMGWDEVADKELVFNNVEGPDAIRDYGAKTAMNFVPPSFIHVPGCTLRDLLTHNLDITAIPKRHFFELAAGHTNDLVHKDRLQEFSSSAYTDEYYDYATRPRRSILEVLHDFPTVKFPFQWALAVFPIIRGRPYSICSSPSEALDQRGGYTKVQILVAMVKYKTVLKKVRQGLCSRYLASLPSGTSIGGHLSPTNKHSPWVLNSEIPDHLVFPVICVAPGTGIAPCRSLIRQRAYAEMEREEGHSKLTKPVGSSYVFFGGRNKSKDYFFEEEYQQPSLLTDTYPAFSRDQKQKIYVQDRLREQGKLIFDLIVSHQARIFVCGSSGNMPKAVRKAFVDILVKYDQNNLGRATAEAYIDDLQRHKRYTQETW